jgi:hypothetical protein
VVGDDLGDEVERFGGCSHGSHLMCPIKRWRRDAPFHPSIRDIVARFAENRGYQKTRALIRLLRLAVRGAFAR